MKFFSWMHNKFNGAQGNNNNNSNTRKSNPASSATHINTKQEPRNIEEFSDWPHALLAIGTFGNNEIKEKNADQEILNIQEEEIEEQPSSPDLAEFTAEEVGKLQKELTKLLRRKPKVVEGGGGEINSGDLPLDKFLNCPSSLEVDRRLSTALSTDLATDKEDDIERTIKEILGRCKDVCKQNKNKSISKKSVSFLLKKMFVCSSGFAPAPSLRDPLPESRMEKLLRAIISKKIYHQQASRASSIKKLIEDKPISKPRKEDEPDKAKDGCKWVKTDSEFIVLEI